MRDLDENEVHVAERCTRETEVRSDLITVEDIVEFVVCFLLGGAEGIAFSHSGNTRRQAPFGTSSQYGGPLEFRMGAALEVDVH